MVISQGSPMIKCLFSLHAGWLAARWQTIVTGVSSRVVVSAGICLGLGPMVVQCLYSCPGGPVRRRVVSVRSDDPTLHQQGYGCSDDILNAILICSMRLTPFDPITLKLQNASHPVFFMYKSYFRWELWKWSDQCKWPHLRQKEEVVHV